jgi:hypothetical protein
LNVAMGEAMTTFLPIVREPFNSFLSDPMELAPVEPDPKRKKSGSEQWKEDHMFAFRSNGLDWPPPMGSEFQDLCRDGGLNERQTEMLFFVCTKTTENSCNERFLNMSKSIMTVPPGEDQSPWTETVPLGGPSAAATPCIWMRVLGAEPEDTHDSDTDQKTCQLAGSVFSAFGIAFAALATFFSADTSHFKREVLHMERVEEDTNSGNSATGCVENVADAD